MKDLENEDMNVFSATECTGLMPTLPDTDEEEENYLELLKVPPKNKKK